MAAPRVASGASGDVSRRADSRGLASRHGGRPRSSNTSGAQVTSSDALREDVCKPSRNGLQDPIETKPFFLTSEFVGAVLAVAGIAITAAASDAFGAWRAWILITAVLVGYRVSRGIAKSGTRSHSSDPREQLDLSFGRGDSTD
jgi:hypothetical protein